MEEGWMQDGCRMDAGCKRRKDRREGKRDSVRGKNRHHILHGFILGCMQL
jgi:hypothetical protein